MTLSFAIALVIFVAISFLLIRFVIPQRKRKAVYIFTGSICAILILCFCLYATNISLRENIKMIFASEVYHDFRINNQVCQIKLPPHTALACRLSDKGAKYVSKTKTDEIVQFYQNIADLNSFIETTMNNIVKLSLSYNSHRFSISISNVSDKNYYFSVDLKE